jgi:hypothetical protein
MDMLKSNVLMLFFGKKSPLFTGYQLSENYVHLFEDLLTKLQNQKQFISVS